MKFLKVPRKRNGICQIQHSKKYINMSDGIPIPGGFQFKINGINVETIEPLPSIRVYEHKIT